MTVWIEEALAPYMKRLQAGPRRNGLSRNMNQVLRSHPESVGIVHRAMIRLAEMELLADLAGEVRFTRQGLYHTLVETEDDWVRLTAKVERLDSLIDPGPAIEHFVQTGEVIQMEHDPEDTTVIFVSDPCYKLRVFDDAMGIAKKIGLIEGYGTFGLHRDFLKRLRILRKQRIVEPPIRYEAIILDGGGALDEPC